MEKTELLKKVEKLMEQAKEDVEILTESNEEGRAEVAWGRFQAFRKVKELIEKEK